MLYRSFESSFNPMITRNNSGIVRTHERGSSLDPAENLLRSISGQSLLVHLRDQARQQAS